MSDSRCPSGKGERSLRPNLNAHAPYFKVPPSGLAHRSHQCVEQMMGKTGCFVCSGGGWDGRLGLVNNLDGWGKRRRTPRTDGRAARVNNDCRGRGHIRRFLFSVGRLVAVGRRVDRLAPLRASQAARASSAPSGGDETRRGGAEGEERSPRDRPRGGWANEDFPTKIIV